MHHRGQPPPPIPEDLLAGLPPLRRETFALRVARWWPDLVAGLAGVYPADVVATAGERLLRAAATAYAAPARTSPRSTA